MQTQSEWNAEKAASATAYSATIFANRQHHTFRFEKQEDAEAAARELTAASTNGRRAMVYAITPEGFTIYVSTPS